MRGHRLDGVLHGLEHRGVLADGREQQFRRAVGDAGTPIEFTNDDPRFKGKVVVLAPPLKLPRIGPIL
jgi:hypothetical protein